MEGILKVAQSDPEETDDVAGQQHLQATYFLERTVNYFSPEEALIALLDLSHRRMCVLEGQEANPW